MYDTLTLYLSNKSFAVARYDENSVLVSLSLSCRKLIKSTSNIYEGCQEILWKTLITLSRCKHGKKAY